MYIYIDLYAYIYISTYKYYFINITFIQLFMCSKVLRAVSIFFRVQ